MVDRAGARGSGQGTGSAAAAPPREPSGSLPGLPPSLRDRAVRPGDRRYELLRSTYVAVASPALVLTPETDAEVAEAIGYAADSGLPVSVRSGGHGLSGRSSNDGGVVIDLSEMRAVEVLDAGSGLVRVQAGARWAEVAARLEPHGLVVSSGDHGNVGVGGLATAGGVGWLARTFGLTIDRVRSARVVLVDGTVVQADRDQHPDLFWAVRGAGDVVGIVTELEVEAMRLGRVGIAEITVEADRRGETLRRWSEYLTEAPPELTTNGVVVPSGQTFVLQLTAVVASDDPDRVRALVAPLADLGVRPLGAQAQIAPYSALVPVGHLHPNVGQQPATSASALLPTLTAASAEAIMDVVAAARRRLVQLRSLGGAINDVPEDETAYSHRHQQVLVIVSAFPPSGGRELDAAMEVLGPFARGAYRSFDSRLDDAAFRRAFPGAVGDRVRELRHRYDPGGVLQRVAGLASG